jgi:hypothetical protein
VIWDGRTNIEISGDGKENTGRSVKENIDRQILEKNRGSWKHPEETQWRYRENQENGEKLGKYCTEEIFCSKNFQKTNSSQLLK